jgi:hypothetical protein
MGLTLNQIISRIGTLALAHKQIRSFYRGAPTDFDIQGGAGDNIYPALFCEKLPGSTNRSEHQHTYNFRLYFYDLINVAEGSQENEQDVLSDMDSVALDFLAMLMSSVYQDDYEVATTSSEESLVQQLGDMVGGSVHEIGIKVDFLADNCQVPAEDVTFNEDIDMARTRILTYTGTGAESDSFTVTDLAGKVVLAVYRAGSYKRAIVTLPTDSDKIQVTGTDLGSRKGILSTTGAVGLQTGDSLVDGEVLDFIIWE